MSGPDDLRLQRLLGGDQLAALRLRLRRRFERAQPGLSVDSIKMSGLGPHEHAALASLLGRAPRYARSLQIDVRSVDAALQRSGVAASLRDALERLDGPITDPAAARLRLEASWSEAIARCRHGDLVGFLRTTIGLALLKRLARRDPAIGAELCRKAETVLRRLPAQGIARSQLAAETLGDAHALDNGQPVATIVLAVWRQLASDGDRLAASLAVPTDDDTAEPTERARDIWARAGVLVNELARPALFLNLPVTVSANAPWRRGEPAYLSLRALVRAPPPWEVLRRKVYVCENPNLVAIAADRLGPDCVPLVCTDGMPGAAQRSLLSQLVQAGADLHFHVDFDWPGIRIGNHLMRTYQAAPWRLGAVDYTDAVRTNAHQPQTLESEAVEASWDAALTAAMRQHRMSFAEEALAGSLLYDLDDRSPK
jgi:uncharacterized protein (TIGR02679 family)